MLISRRQMLRSSAVGFGSLALASLLAEEARANPVVSHTPSDPLAPRPPHFTPRAKRVIFLFMKGGPSHVDTFDYKPELIKRSGEKFEPGQRVESATSTPGNIMKNPFEWKQHGQCGRQDGECSDDQQVGRERRPAEHRHAHVGHAGSMNLQDRRDEVDAGQQGPHTGDLDCP